MDYTTQMDAARKGIVTPQMKIVAEKEHMPVEKLMALVASGKVAIPANKVHTSLSPEAVGQDCRTKINVNLGVSPEHNNHEEELQKSPECHRHESRSYHGLVQFRQDP